MLENDMKEIKVLSFAKINLSIDITGVRDNGMHEVDMIMQQLSFHDDVIIRFEKLPNREPGDFDIVVSTNRYYIPVDERNLAYKAAQLMIDRYAAELPGGQIRIDIFKRIPVAAGLAGGSGNGAAVLHGLNLLWNLGLNLQELYELSKELGSDVPFCTAGQARLNFGFPAKLRKGSPAGTCARAEGTGTEMRFLPGIRKPVVIAKPPMGVSTAEVYRGIDSCILKERPDNNALERGLRNRDFDLIYSNCINVLENYTLQAYPQVRKLKEIMERDRAAEKVLMSGSGPTVFAVYGNIVDAKKACGRLRRQGYEAYWTKTTK